MLRPPVNSALQLNFRNQAKLQAYQQEYERRKRAPGHRKVSKVERQLLEEQYVEKQSIMKAVDLPKTPGTALFQFVFSPLVILFLYRHHLGVMSVHLLYVHELWTRNALQVWSMRNKVLSSTLRN